MRQKSLALEGIHTEEEFQSALIKKFNFPDYYGKNLDAFDECLADFCEGMTVVVTGLESLDHALRNKVDRYIEIMREFEAESNHSFRLIVQTPY